MAIVYKPHRMRFFLSLFFFLFFFLFCWVYLFSETKVNQEYLKSSENPVLHVITT